MPSPGTRIPNRGAIDFEELKIQFKDGEKTVTRTLETATREDLLEAIGQLSGRPKRVKQSPAAKAAVAAVKEAAVEGVEATATKTQLVLRVPYDRLGEFCKALAGFKVPTG